MFNQTLTFASFLVDLAIVAAYYFAATPHIVDIGGNLGSLLIEILLANPHLKGTLFDRPTVIESAKKALTSPNK